jgi:L-threonylcarbamoyladenylate synthase
MTSLLDVRGEQAKTKRLDIRNSDHIAYAARLIAQGEVIVAGFNGVFGIFGDADNKQAAEKIYHVKNRPLDRNLILVSPPEFLHEHVDTSAPLFTRHSLEQMQQLYRQLHALGAILPARPASAPPFLVVNNTILNIWTEYNPHQPIRQLVAHLRTLGKRALVGTSANRSGEPTHINPAHVFADFNGTVAAVLLDSFRHLPPQRKQSTSIIDFSGEVPRLHREGNVPREELEAALTRLGFGTLVCPPSVIRVNSRAQT